MPKTHNVHKRFYTNVFIQLRKNSCKIKFLNGSYAKSSYSDTRIRMMYLFAYTIRRYRMLIFLPLPIKIVIQILSRQPDLKLQSNVKSVLKADKLFCFFKR